MNHLSQVLTKRCPMCSLCSRRYSSTWTSRRVRSTFTDFFASYGHEIVPASSVIPKKGEGTYFTNAGMNQFKPIFLGECRPTSSLAHLTRAANSQKCIRVGGKHNDLEDVGLDLTHHTFFEMLGNWSFGDYFKRKACSLAYELLTDRYKISPNRLYFTYFAGDNKLNVPPDEECRDIWLSLEIPAERVLPFDKVDNFWDMGETGPCGPCTEIHYDHIGGRVAHQEVNSGSPNLVEIWNLVFMQYNRLSDGSLQPLPAQHVDTGMGLERLTALLNGSADNYSIDLFLPQFGAIQQICGTPAYSGSLGQLDSSYRMLADHTRMITVAIADGLLPSNDNLGHKLRSIMHKCIHLCRNVFQADTYKLLPLLVNLTVEHLSCAYPDLEVQKSKVLDVLGATIHHHDKHREAAISSFNKMVARCQGNVISGQVIESLEVGQYGSPVPLDLILELANLRGMQINLQEYKDLTQTKLVSHSPQQKVQDSSVSLVKRMFAADVAPTIDNYKYDYFPLNEAEYDFREMQSIPSKVQGLSHQGQVTSTLLEGQQGEVILDNTCFYAEAGGQEGDGGTLSSGTGDFAVTDTQTKQGFIIHYGSVTHGHLSLDQSIHPSICQERREGCMRNHTATHLLNSALVDEIPSTQQQGSSVTPYKFTFDFLALNQLPAQFIENVEKSVQAIIKAEECISRTVLPLQEATDLPGVRTLQNEDYPDTVAVIIVGDRGQCSISTELCGGTHVSNTGHLGDFCVTKLSPKSQNIKRITCVTGKEAQQALESGQVLKMVSNLLQSVDLYKPDLQHSWGNIADISVKLQQLVESRCERIEHSLCLLPDCDIEQRARLHNMLEETEKSLSWVRSVLALGIDSETSNGVSVLRKIVAVLKKGKDLDLMQKSSRDKAEHCLHLLEHKVTEAINQKMVAALQQDIENSAQETDIVTNLGFFIPTEFAPRQIPKVFKIDWRVWEKTNCITLVHFSNKGVIITHALRTDVDGGTSPDVVFADILTRLNEVTPTKRKQLHCSNNTQIVTYTMNKKNFRTVDKTVIKSCFPSKYAWLDVCNR